MEQQNNTDDKLDLTKKSSKNKKMKATLLILLGLVLAGGLVYGVYTWQQTRIDDANKSANELNSQIGVLDKKVKSLESDLSKEKEAQEKSKYSFSLKDITEALPKSCELNAKTVADIKTVNSSDTAAGALQQSENGRINAAKSWLYASGGCGTQAFGFVLARLANNSWVIVDTSWSNLPICSRVHENGVPKEVVGKCIDQDDNDRELTIRQ